MKFKVGDKVRIVSWIDEYGYAWNNSDIVGKIGKITKIEGNVYLIDNNKYCVNFTDNMLELVTAKKEKEIEPPFYVDCPTSEIWDRVMAKIKRLGYKEELNLGFTPNFKIQVDEYDGEICYWTWVNSCVFSGKHIPYSEFLGEEDNVGDFKVGDRVRILGRNTYCDLNEGVIYEINGDICHIKDNGGYNHYACDIPLKSIEKVEAPQTATEYANSTYRESSGKPLTLRDMEEAVKAMWAPMPDQTWIPAHLGKPIKSFTQQIMDTLRSIPDRLKRALNANLRAFYKLGWIDGDLDVTADGREELINFLFDKHEKELGVIALKRVKDASKKKKDEDEEEESEE